jgi:polysaccharide biosynthesis transport protein
MTTPLGDPAPVSPKEIDLRFYTGLLWRGRWLLLTSVVVGLGLGILVGYLQVPVYRASAMLQIDPPTPTFMTVTDALVGSGYWQNADYYNTQFRILRSSSLGAKVVDELKLRERPPFKGYEDPGRLFMAAVQVDPIKETRLVTVSVEHNDPQDAALWVNGLAEVFVRETIALRVDTALQASQWLQERLDATQKGMRDSQEKFYKALEGQDLFVPEGSVSAVATSISKLNEDFIQAQARRIQIEAALKQVRDMTARAQSLDTVPQVATDSQIAALDAQLTSLNIELTRLKEKYKEGHPEVQRVLAQMEQLRKVKDARAGQIVGALQSELKQIQKREGELKAVIDQQKSLAASQSRKATELEALKKETDSSKGLYDVLLQKLNETDIASSIRNNNVSIIERALPPRGPISPRRGRIATIGVLLGLALGIGLVVGRDFLDNTIKDPEEIERYLHLELLAAVPRFNDANLSLVTEAYQNLRTALLFARREETGQIVLVASTAPQEGKTTTIVNMGRLLASAGERTLIVDLDLRRGQVHQRLGLTREPGLTTFFAKHETIEALVRPTHTPNLFAITAGPAPPNPPALLGRKKIGEFLDQFRSQFEWILLDSPPLASVTDAILLARHVDMALLVVEHNKVDKKVIKRQVTALAKATPVLLGAILNIVDMKAKGYHYYYYSHVDGAKRSRPRPAEKAASQ